MRVFVAAALTAITISGAALAQSPAVDVSPHGPESRMNHTDMAHGSAPMQHQGMHAPAAASSVVPSEPGQAAFAAIQEIVQILEADPRTDWSKVDVERLRQHLIDMNNVTLQAKVQSEPVEGGIRFTVTGEGLVRDSIRRMVSAHAATMNGFDGWRFSATESDGGATLTVLPPHDDLPKLRGLGFIGVMARGMHHQEHHLLLARGEQHGQ
jgi:hypothetical protein